MGFCVFKVNLKEECIKILKKFWDFVKVIKKWFLRDRGGALPICMKSVEGMNQISVKSKRFSQIREFQNPKTVELKIFSRVR